MVLSDSSRNSIIPSYLYSFSSQKSSSLHATTSTATAFNGAAASDSSSVPRSRSFVVPSPSEPFGKIELYSPAFYAACTAGGILSCGLTHTTVTPLDLVKCNMQAYGSTFIINHKKRVNR
ncbi:hypothetical protein Ddye_004611 [Dipteronia dyeriana]|uniref:Uncharacterized protein n=1 Tax=Dipteronia dyeriana TaxID=168575 RepID=A0AAD9XV96_9ROSI|nr:hypothetical protein Ddye_004611 [Dipteronia dyeriana]